jgi:hypothetical protein
MQINKEPSCFWLVKSKHSMYNYFYDGFSCYFQLISLQVDKANLGYNFSCFDLKAKVFLGIVFVVKMAIIHWKM